MKKGTIKDGKQLYSITLWFYIPDQKNNEKLYFDLPLNYKKNLLFDKLPYMAQLNNPAIDDVVKGKKNDDLSI